MAFISVTPDVVRRTAQAYLEHHRQALEAAKESKIYDWVHRTNSGIFKRKAAPGSREKAIKALSRKNAQGISAFDVLELEFQMHERLAQRYQSLSQLALEANSSAVLLTEKEMQELHPFWGSVKAADSEGQVLSTKSHVKAA